MEEIEITEVLIIEIVELEEHAKHQPRPHFGPPPGGQGQPSQGPPPRGSDRSNSRDRNFRLGKN